MRVARPTMAVYHCLIVEQDVTGGSCDRTHAGEPQSKESRKRRDGMKAGGNADVSRACKAKPQLTYSKYEGACGR